MTEPMIRVVVAPGQRLAIRPHPSGMTELGALYLDQGEGLRVTRERAEELYAAGTVLHPVTGLPRPAQVVLTPPIVSQSAESFASLAARAELESPSAPKPVRREQDLDSWRAGIQVEPRDPRTMEQHINVGERRHQW